MTTTPVADYDERLNVPLRWWLLAAVFLATLWIAFAVAIPWPLVVWGSIGLLAAGTAALFLGYGGQRVSVREGELRAGRARIPVSLLADPVALDRQETRRLTGVDADARAYLLLRPYLQKAVKVTVRDPADPTPYWLVSTRRPDQLAAALSAAVQRSRKG